MWALFVYACASSAHIYYQGIERSISASHRLDGMVKLKQLAVYLQQLLGELAGSSPAKSLMPAFSAIRPSDIFADRAGGAHLYQRANLQHRQYPLGRGAAVPLQLG